MTSTTLKNTVIIEGLKTDRFDANLTLVASYGDTQVFEVKGMTAKALIAAMTLEDATGEFGLATDTELDGLNVIAENSQPETYTLDGDVASYRVGDGLYLRATGSGYRWAKSA